MHSSQIQLSPVLEVIKAYGLGEQREQAITALLSQEKTQEAVSSWLEQQKESVINSSPLLTDLKRRISGESSPKKLKTLAQNRFHPTKVEDLILSKNTGRSH